MTPEKVLGLIGRYEVEIEEKLARGRPRPALEVERLRHLLTMIPTMRGFIADGWMDKAFRWLGFMQGALWAYDVFPLEALKDHNRPDPSA